MLQCNFSKVGYLGRVFTTSWSFFIVLPVIGVLEVDEVDEVDKVAASLLRYDHLWCCFCSFQVCIMIAGLL